MSSLPFKRIAIIGFGLMGSSIARALKQYYSECVLVAYDIERKPLALARAHRIVNITTTNPVIAVSGADCIIFCTPLGAYSSVMEQIAPYISPVTVITDVGSVKKPVIEMMTSGTPDCQYPFLIPAHPIAGSEQSGMAAGRADLFQGKHVILTPSSPYNVVAYAKVEALWQACGAEVCYMTASGHDLLYATLSHSVQCLLYGVGSVLKDQKAGDTAFKQFIRIAASNPIIWKDIIHYNLRAVTEAEDKVRVAFSTLKDQIERGDSAELDVVLKEMRDRRYAMGDVRLHEDAPPQVDVATTLFPVMVATAIMKHAHTLRYAGSGFRDVTQVLTSYAWVTGERLIAGKETLLPLMEQVIWLWEGDLITARFLGVSNAMLLQKRKNNDTT